MVLFPALKAKQKLGSTRKQYFLPTLLSGFGGGFSV
jgi:hypothetical protein